MIKKIILSTVLITGLNAYGQENKNKFVVNANVRFNSSSSPINFDGASIGYFLTNNFAVGITGNQSRSVHTIKSTNLNTVINNKYDQINSQSGAFARYNHLFHNDRLGWFLQLNGIYTFGRTKWTQTYETTGVTNESIAFSRNKGFLVSLSPGIIYFINNWFSIEASLGDISYSTYSYGENLNGMQKKTSDFNSSIFTSGIRLGLSFYFGCKKTNVKATE